MSATVSHSRKGYSAFYGEEHIVRGFRGQGLYRVRIMDRIKVQGEIDTDQRHMYCQVIEPLRDKCFLGPGRIAVIQIQHSTKEVSGRLLRGIGESSFEKGILPGF